MKICVVPKNKIGGTMRCKEEKKKRQGSDLIKMIETVEQALATAKKVYRLIEPIVNAFTNRPKSK